MFERALERALREAVEDTPVLFVAGARQTGKSTLVQAFARGGGNWTSKTFDDLATLSAARADPQGFVERLGDRAILDEVQRVPELFLPLKASVDRDRRAGRFLLTGSANVLALPRVAESLAGRMEILTLWPLTQAEIEGVSAGFVDACFDGRPERLALSRSGRPELLRRALRGGYPEVVARTRDDARARWFDAYVAALVQRDLRDLSSIERMEEIPRLLQVVAGRTGALLNVADLGRTLGLNQMTLKRYLTLLEALYLIVRLPPWFENRGKRLTRTAKVYVNDPGLFGRLASLDPAGLDARPAEVGPLVETFVVTELLRTAASSAERPRLHHFRTAAGHEVDVVLEGRRGRLVGIEAKAGVTVSEADFRGLRALREQAGERFVCGVVLYAGADPLPFGPGLWAVPHAALWSPAPRR